ncbi:hypothetical protein CsSME_00023235 [Camellia sinensis var. sinensis]
MCKCKWYSPINGLDHPCAMIQRTVYWMVPSSYSSKFNIDFFFLSRFSELTVHTPSETLLHSFLATLLSPLRWATSKLVESYLTWELPLKKYKTKVEEGSIVLKKSQSMSFCSEDLVILATGFKGDEKLKNMFTSPTFQKFIKGPTTTQVPLYRFSP